MFKPLAIAKRSTKRKGTQPRRPAYRAVTLGVLGEEWAVIDDRGTVVYRGDARAAAMIASRLTRPGAQGPRV